MGRLFFGMDAPFIRHSGVAHNENPPGRGSGRYAWGSGAHGKQRANHAIPWTKEGYDYMIKYGATKQQIAEFYGISVYQQRSNLSTAKHEKMANERAMLLKLIEENPGISYRQLSAKTGISISTIRNRLADHADHTIKKEESYKQILRDQIEAKGHIDVGKGAEHYLGISKEHLKRLIDELEEEGYVVSKPRMQQAGTSYNTNMKTLSQKGTPKNYIYKHIEEIQTLDDLNVIEGEDGPKVAEFHSPVSVDSSRVQIVYNEDGGVDKDGVVELRRGVDDISLGKNNYAQVRIAVDGTHYIKGMAVYADDLPEGVDLRFNTNKHKGTPALGPDNDHTVLKLLKGEGLSGFKATVRAQNDWVDKDGVKHEGAINIVKEQGLWHEQQLTLANQFLGKQAPSLAKQQLSIDFKDREDEFKTIMNLTNPEVKQRMLKSFADECDAAAVHLKAAALPRQAWNVILPVNSLAPDEIYAPGFKDGEEVVCIRYPHGGRFELRQLKVNNRNKEGQNMIGKRGLDAVGITKSSADILSGADFDGDTVLVIPNPKVPTKNGKYTYRIQVDSPLEGLKDFDPKEQYKGYEGMKRMTKPETQKKMGEVSNLIMDMTLQDATEEELARAVRHSMVVIDAEKHGLDFRRSYKDNNILELKKKFQMNANGKAGGAATLLTRAKSPEYVYQRVSNQPYYIDEETGKKLWNTEKDRTYTDKEGNLHTIKPRKVESSKMMETDDATTLYSGSKSARRIEEVYGEYANNCKRLGDLARKEYMYSYRNEKIDYSPEAAEKYAEEVKSLDDKLLLAEKNAPKERAAQRLAHQWVTQQADAALLEGNEMTDGDKRKSLAKQITRAREIVGAKKTRVTFTDKEWEAVENGAIRKTTLRKLLANADEADYKEKATPREKRGLSSAKIAKIERMLAAVNDDETNRLTIQWISETMGVSTSTIASIQNGTYKKGGK